MKASTQIAVFSTVVAMLSAGCSSNVTLAPPTIPVPLLNKIPVSVGVRLPDEFEHFVHQEEVLGRENWSIDLGRSNAALFTQLFEHMFAESIFLEPDDDPTTLDIDALIEPSIDAFEFSVPSQSRTDSFAVWIRYRLRVYDRTGAVVANWPVSAYGKSQKAGLGNSEALRRAAILAMRDAAALMIMQFDKATGISALASPPQTASPSPASAPDDAELPADALKVRNDDAS